MVFKNLRRKRKGTNYCSLAFDASSPPVTLTRKSLLPSSFKDSPLHRKCMDNSTRFSFHRCFCKLTNNLIIP